MDGPIAVNIIFLLCHSLKSQYTTENVHDVPINRSD